MLESISIKFDPVEDRLLLRVRSRDGEGVSREQALHLTRRVCAHWGRQVQAMVELSAEVPQRLDRPARQAMAVSHHQAMAHQANYRPPAPEEARPPEQAPVLVTDITCGRRRSDGRWVMKFELQRQAPMSLVLSGRTMHGVIDLLARRLKDTGWGLAPLPGVTAAAPAAPQGGGALH